MQPKNQEHFRRPPADALDGRQGGDHLFIRQRLDVIQWQRTVAHARTEIANVTKLLAAETAGAQSLVRNGRDRFGCRDTAVEQRIHPRTDRPGGLRRQLLRDNRVDERPERIRMLRAIEAARPMRANQLAHDRVASRQQPPRSRIISRRHGNDDRDSRSANPDS